MDSGGWPHGINGGESYHFQTEFELLGQERAGAWKGSISYAWGVRKIKERRRVVSYQCDTGSIQAIIGLTFVCRQYYKVV